MAPKSAFHQSSLIRRFKRFFVTIWNREPDFTKIWECFKGIIAVVPAGMRFEYPLGW